MKLTWRIVIRISIFMSLILLIWGLLFHQAVIKEVNDETDDSLELFSENLITRFLQGETLPKADNGTNNTYFLKPISKYYADTHPHLDYTNRMIYVVHKSEYEPSRVLRTIFCDKHGAYHELIVATPTVESKDLYEAIAHWVIILYMTLLILIIAVCIGVISRSMRPLYGILKWIHENNISDGVQPLNNPTTISEFARLNEALMESAKRNEQLYMQQKLFTGNASHEIQTPLAICQNRLEMLIETPLSEEQLEEVIKIQETLSGLSRLNRELLMLAKIDGKQYKDSTEIDLTELLESSIENLSLIYKEQNIKVKQTIQKDFKIKMNQTLASVLITNLVKNAYVHNCEGGQIELLLNQDQLTIANSGVDAALHESSLFERFYQGESHKKNSTGLGLALVKAICDIYQFKITYQYVEKKHCFQILFN
ncbi:MAG: HAMP domain-containing histidine kinase [Bacteroidia bacterium]|nr:HAMP domain-containing histidine kinase [Bacteroidia bacterium]